jgi:hypothetical protein
MKIILYFMYFKHACALGDITRTAVMVIAVAALAE